MTTLNDRQRAWKLIYDQIKRRPDGEAEGDLKAEVITTMGEADDLTELIVQLVGFGRILAFFGNNGNEFTLAGLRALNDSVLSEKDGEPSF